MFAGIKNMQKPLKQKDLDNENGPVVTTIMKIYSMESFIVYNLNKTAREKDESMLPAYGPYAAVLSYIIGKRKEQKNLVLYRGIKMPKSKIAEY